MGYLEWLALMKQPIETTAYLMGAILATLQVLGILLSLLLQSLATALRALAMVLNCLVRKLKKSNLSDDKLHPFH